ncbi:MAG: calcium-binding protein [Microcoleus sp. SU_5_3]|nr:calcium-binding protein [Microcoleus sp. SU_5_3]
MTIKRQGIYLIGEDTADNIALEAGQLQDIPGGLVTRKGNDTVSGSSDAEVVYSGKGNDEIEGGGGNDSLRGDKDEDTVFGGDGDDCLCGGQGNDSIVGGSGNDSLHGDRGIDTLTGGSGNDTFFLLLDDESIDYITDYQNGGDRIASDNGILNFDNYTFSPGTGANGAGSRDTVMIDKSSNRAIAVLLNVPSSTFAATPTPIATPTPTTIPTPTTVATPTPTPTTVPTPTPTPATVPTPTPTPTDLAGNTLLTARNIGVLSGTQTFSDAVGDIDTEDFYRLQITAPSDINIALSGLNADADLIFVEDINNNGAIDSDGFNSFEVLGISDEFGTNSEELQGTLQPGEYLIWVSQFEPTFRRCDRPIEYF